MNTLFDKIWDAHVVSDLPDGPQQVYIDRLYCHEVTSPQAFDGLRARGIRCLRPERIYCMPDHNTPTHDQDKPIEDPVSKAQVDALERNAREFGLTYYGMMSPDNGIIHVVGLDHRLRRLAHLHPWRDGRSRFRHRYLRGRNGPRFPVHPAEETQDDEHPH